MRHARLPLLLSSLVGMVLNFYTLAFAQDDPFDFLFTQEERTAAGETAGISQDDLIITALYLNEIELSESYSAYQTRTGICLVWGELLTLLEFPINMNSDNTLAEGWFIDEARKIEVNFETKIVTLGRKSISLGKEDILTIGNQYCLTPDALSKIFPIKAKYVSTDLRIALSATEVLPIEKKIERKKAQERLNRKIPSTTKYVQLKNPYKYFSLPVGDIALDINLQKETKSRIATNIETTFDILKTNAFVRTTVNSKNNEISTRITFSRDNRYWKNATQVDTTSFQFGDIVVPRLPLLSKSEAGRGFVFSNHPKESTEEFDQTEIRGHLPPGWEAELYIDENLYAFQSAPNENGEYSFANTPLKAGYNRIEVKLIGPYGETKTRLHKILIGPGMLPQDHGQFRVGFLEKNISLLGKPIKKSLSSLKTKHQSILTSFASYERGLHERISLRVDAKIERDSSNQYNYYFGNSFNISSFGAFSTFRWVIDSSKNISLHGVVQKRLNPRTNITIETQKGEQLSSVKQGENKAERVNIRLDSAISLKSKQIPIQVIASRQKNHQGDESFAISKRISSSFGRIRFTNLLNYRRNLSGDILNGQLLLSGHIDKTKIRSELSYDLKNTKFERYAIDLQRKIGQDNIFQATLSHSFSDTSWAGQLNWARQYKRFTAQAGLEGNTNGEWALRFSHSFSLYNDKSSGKYLMTRPGLTRTASIRPISYLDHNRNNTQEQNEETINLIAYKAAGSVKKENSQQHDFLLRDLGAGRFTETQIHRPSLINIYTKPAALPYGVSIRAGQILDIEYPVIQVGEVEGRVGLSRGEKFTPISGVKIVLLSPNGKIVAESKSQYDGYFYFSDILFGEYTAMISPQFSQGKYIVSNTEIFSISNVEPFANGIFLRIFEKGQS